MGLELRALRWVRSQDARGLLGAIYFGLAAFAYHAGPGRQRLLSLIALGCLALLAWGAALRRARTIANMATSHIASAAQGYVELQGRTSAEALIASPYSNTPCIWYRYRVYEQDKDRDWREIESSTSSATFDINDGTGACTVDPDDAEVIGAEMQTQLKGSYKHVEALLHAGRSLYVLGEFSTIGGANSSLNLHDDVGALLAEWKQNPHELLRRFDLNRDGTIDEHEWELARRLATSTVEQQHRTLRQQPGVNMVRAPQDGRLFMISALPPQRLRQRYLLWSLLHLALCLGSAVLAVGVAKGA